MLLIIFITLISVKQYPLFILLTILTDLLDWANILYSFQLIIGFYLLFNLNIANFYNRMFGIASLSLILLAFIHLRLISIENAYFMALHGIGGGLHGYYIASHLNIILAYPVLISLIALGLIALLFTTELSFIYI